MDRQGRNASARRTGSDRTLRSIARRRTSSAAFCLRLPATPPSTSGGDVQGRAGFKSRGGPESSRPVFAGSDIRTSVPIPMPLVPLERRRGAGIPGSVGRRGSGRSEDVASEGGWVAGAGGIAAAAAADVWSAISSCFTLAATVSTREGFGSKENESAGLTLTSSDTLEVLAKMRSPAVLLMSSPINCTAPIHA
jgi:hypothetical protein